MDLVLRDLLLGLAAAAEQREDQLAGEIEQEDERQRDPRQNVHRGRDLDRDALGVAQRHLLRHQLADDQGGVGDERDDDADADDVGNP